MPSFTTFPRDINKYILKLIYLNSDDKSKSNIAQTCKFFRLLYLEITNTLCPLRVTFVNLILNIITNENFKEKDKIITAKSIAFFMISENMVRENKYKGIYQFFENEADKTDRNNIRFEKSGDITQYLNHCDQLISILAKRGFIASSNGRDIHEKILNANDHTKNKKYLGCTIS